MAASRPRSGRGAPTRGGSCAPPREKTGAPPGRAPATEGLQITTATGDDSEVAQVVSRAIAERRLIELEYYKENEDVFTTRRVEPYQLLNGQEGWYVHAFDPDKDAPRSFRLDRLRTATMNDD